jgi:hypothetical protein
MHLCGSEAFDLLIPHFTACSSRSSDMPCRCWISYLFTCHAFVLSCITLQAALATKLDRSEIGHVQTLLTKVSAVAKFMNDSEARIEAIENMSHIAERRTRYIITTVCAQSCCCTAQSLIL